ncbi:hypothetical protein [Microtetraspora glauca]|uniref:PE domain-containing protein n=1 Tax=Microtetraspora glauca TaxID=1996 RepID=A0ABV3G6V2_MICGL
MTQKDAVDGGGGDTFQVDPKWPGLDGDVPLKYSVSDIRKVAEDLRAYLAGTEGPAYAEGYTTGSLSSVEGNCRINAAQIGTWTDARALADTVGPGGEKFTDAYRRFHEAYVAVIEAMEVSASVYEKTNPPNEG